MGAMKTSLEMESLEKSYFIEVKNIMGNFFICTKIINSCDGWCETFTSIPSQSCVDVTESSCRAKQRTSLSSNSPCVQKVDQTAYISLRLVAGMLPDDFS